MVCTFSSTKRASCMHSLFSRLMLFLAVLGHVMCEDPPAGCAAPVIRVGASSILGSCSAFSARDLDVPTRDVASYRGLRYAQPPTGPGRFSAPELANVDQDLVDGTKAGSSCPQGPHPVYKAERGTSEDCLVLDVFVPLPKPEKAAVMVWIHGGGFMFGAGTVNLLSPLPLVSLGDVIVVTINYRLGALGYLTTGDEEIPPNLGILDQITSLRWIKKYITAFGGDPERVTLFGDSAGSSSVHIHLMSPLSKGLFHRGILQSGTATSSWARGPSLEATRKRAFTLGRMVGCGDVVSSADLKKCLAAVPAEEMVAHQQAVLLETGEPAAIAFVPVVDHNIIPDQPDIVGRSGNYNNVTIIIGANVDEGMMAMMSLFPDATTTTPTVSRGQFHRYMSNVIHVSDPALLGLVEYVYEIHDHGRQKRGELYEGDADGDNDDTSISKDDAGRDEEFDGTCAVDHRESCLREDESDFFDTLNDIIGDMTMFCPTDAVANFAANSGMNVYRYHMTHRPSSSFWRPLTWTRVNHGENLLFVFGVHFFPHLNWTLTPEEVDMTAQIIQYWTNFAATGNPNRRGDNRHVTTELEEWPIYDSKSEISKNLSPMMPNEARFKSQICRFWNSIFPNFHKGL